MKTWKSAFLIALVLSLVLAVACGDDDDDRGSPYLDDDADDDADDDDFYHPAFSCSGEVCTDPAVGLMWQNEDTTSYTRWESSIDYCESLDAGDGFGGFHGWRLPTISELRSLIRGCPETVTGGKCNVTDDCLSCGECWGDLCWNCEQFGGPGPEGRYWPEGMEGTTYCYWSSSERTDSESASAWYANFAIGSIDRMDTSGSQGFGTRCVRGL